MADRPLMERGEQSPHEVERRHRQRARFGAVFFGAAAAVTLLGLLFPHQPEVDEAGLGVVVAICGVASGLLFARGERAPEWVYMGVLALGSAVVSMALLFNGERAGGSAGGDEMYYLWVVIFAAYFFGRVATAVQVALVLALYAVTLAVIDPADVAVSRWLSTAGLVIGTAVVVRMLSERIEGLLHRLGVAARTDSLTGLSNRLAFEEAYTSEAARLERHGTPYALLLADLDQLKEINDRFGHQAGDEAICAVGNTLRQELRRGDFAARIGGDEFALLLPVTNEEGAKELGTRLAHQLCERGPAAHALGLSFGVAVPGRDGDTLDDLMRAADQALYAAKRKGSTGRRGRRNEPTGTSAALR
jgi:diguanylate cyclase (GGDEF)-like protein